MKKLSLNQIIKIDRKEQAFDVFKFGIKSKTKKMLELEFHDCCIKLLQMRNKLAHEFQGLDLEKETIELLHETQIAGSKDWLEGYELKYMTQQSKQIFSNYIIMEELLEILLDKKNKDEEQ